MIPVANRPILEHIVDALEMAAVDEAILVVGANRERVQDYFGNGFDRDIDISYVVQEQQLGTGHALLQAEAQIGEPFVALNGDRIIACSLIDDVWECHRNTDDVVVGVKRTENPSRYGVVKLEDGDIVGIEEQPLPDLTTSNFINAGVYAFTPDIFAAIRQTESHGEQALTDTINTLTTEQRVRAVQYRDRWLDVSEPWDLLFVNDALIDDVSHAPRTHANVDDSASVSDAAIFAEDVTVHPNATILRDVTLGENVRIGAGAVLENSIVLPDAAIAPGAVVRDCIVGANTTIGANTTVDGGDTDVVLNDTVYRDVRFGGLLGDNVDVGGNVTVEPGTIIGNDATIGPGSLVSGRIDDSAHVTRG